MSLQVLHRRNPRGTAVQADLEAIQNGEKAPINIDQPTENVEMLTAEGESFIFDSFTYYDSLELGHFLHARLCTEPRAALISITLAGAGVGGGPTIFQTATGAGITPDTELWARRKTASVLRWGCSTWLMHCKFRGNEEAFAAKYGMDKAQASQYSIHGGGVPIRVKGVEGIVAVVAVSGLKQHEDHGVIVDVVKENWRPIG